MVQESWKMFFELDFSLQARRERFQEVDSLLADLVIICLPSQIRSSKKFISQAPLDRKEQPFSPTLFSSALTVKYLNSAS